MKDFTKTTIREIENYKNALETVDNFHGKILQMIQDTSDPQADEIVFVDFEYLDWFNNKNLFEVCYGYGNGYGRETIGIPRTWLNEGFDYKADYKHRLELEKERKRRAAEAKRRNQEENREQKEREEYERLKKKFKE